MAFDKNHTTTAQKVIIIIFAVVLVVSMCLPFFSSCSSTAGQAATGTATEEADQATTAPTTGSTVAAVRSRYASIIASLENRLSSNAENTTAMASLGNNYMDMAGELASATDLADEPNAAIDAYTKAVEYYDMYLARAESNAVHVDRDICLFYSGLVEDAIADLRDFTQAGGADYANAWFNLGVMLFSENSYEECIEAFQHAVDLDPDGSQGAGANASLYQSIAQSMLDSQEQAAEEGEAGAEEGTTEAAADATAPATTEPVEPATTEPVESADSKTN